jgi:hypothetical protein
MTNDLLLHTMTLTKDRPVLSSERASHKNKTRKLTDWPSVAMGRWLCKNRRKVTIIWKENHPKDLCGPTVDPNGLRRRRRNEETNTLLKQGSIVRYIKAQRLAWLGYLERLHEERTTKKTTRWKPLSSRPTGRPEKKWEQDGLQGLQVMKIES